MDTQPKSQSVIVSTGYFGKYHLNLMLQVSFAIIMTINYKWLKICYTMSTNVDS